MTSTPVLRSYSAPSNDGTRRIAGRKSASLPVCELYDAHSYSSSETLYGEYVAVPAPSFVAGFTRLTGIASTRSRETTVKKEKTGGCAGG